MNVKDRMTKNPFAVKKDDSVSDARDMMKRERIHRLPVIDEKGQVIGVITEKDILYASPSPASTLDVWEMSSLLAKLKVGAVMTPNPLCCAPTEIIEEAARIMSDNNIAGLPVVENNLLVGIITESDLFSVFVELFAIRDKGLRMTALVPNEPGELAKLAGAVSEAGGDILAFGSVRGENPTNVLVMMKVRGMDEESLRNRISPFVEVIREIRDV